MKTIEDWFKINKNKTIEYNVYRKIFTPFEISEKSPTQSEFIRENFIKGTLYDYFVINNEGVIGIRRTIFNTEIGIVEYHRISDIIFHLVDDYNNED